MWLAAHNARQQRAATAIGVVGNPFIPGLPLNAQPPKSPTCGLSRYFFGLRRSGFLGCLRADSSVHPPIFGQADNRKLREVRPV